MLPGILNIKICSNCGDLIGEDVLLSGNTFGADFYTDGKINAPMLPEHYVLFKCPHCQSLLWSDDLQISELDNQTNVAPYLTPSFNDYIYKLKEGDAGREEYLRVKAWHVGNDQRRQKNSKLELSIDEINNLKELTGIVDSINDGNILKAEIKRELSLFSESIDILKDFNDFSMDIVHTIRRLSLEKESFVSLVDEYCEDLDNDGVKVLEGYKVGGEKHGLWIGYYANGNKKCENNYINGKKIGTQIVWYENGNKKSECELIDSSWLNCESYKIKKYFESGNIESITGNLVDDGNLSGLCTWFYENGQKKEEGGFIPGTDFFDESKEYDVYDFAKWEPPRRDGLWSYWYATGQKKAQCFYLDNVRDGLYIGYYKNGQKKVEKTYKAVEEEAWEPYEVPKKMLSLKDGISIVWRKDGKKKLEVIYKDNSIIK